MDALYHSPTTETFLSNSLKDHARLFAVACGAKILRERKGEDEYLSDCWIPLTLNSQAADDHTGVPNPTWPEPLLSTPPANHGAD